MKTGIIILSAVVFIIVITLTIYFYNKREKRAGRHSQPTGIISQYWQPIVLISVGISLVITYLLMDFTT